MEITLSRVPVLLEISKIGKLHFYTPLPPASYHGSRWKAKGGTPMLTDGGRQLRMMLLELPGCAIELIAATIGVLNVLL